jgi:hypothetical protein
MAEMTEVMRWSQTAIDLAEGDQAKGNFIIGSPLALAFASRGTARWCLGRAGWRDDLERAVSMARKADRSHAIVMGWTYFCPIACGPLLADDAALRDIDEALEVMEGTGDDLALGFLV